MPPRRELSPDMRARIFELSSIGWSPRRIHTQHPEIPRPTIRSLIQRAKHNFQKDTISKPRSGRPRALTEEQRDHVYDIVNHTNPDIKMRDLLREVDDKCKKRCMQRLLQEMGNVLHESGHVINRPDNMHEAALLKSAELSESRPKSASNQHSSRQFLHFPHPEASPNDFMAHDWSAA